ncbi:PREDICTED: dehydrogenase/reductase SDR family member 11-like [Wasmannia auropunctata]|uniref:dehydrogenase/reductase SDR family member 11-like n=1 Tax=Wasmannia auropunctata TaxID=64793 RepID=UPI0005EF3FEE|nr:PREDICTED: dehydrogenase/reductase SDR family member 11-like [Wasmannia auropunctata]
MSILSNKIALVTGACSGIGKAIVEELVSKGLKVVGLSNDINKLKILVDELKGKPGKLYPLQCDLSLPNEIEGASEWIEKNLGGVDILINNASLSLDWSSINGGIQELKKTIDVNVLGLSLITKKILQLMKNKGIDNGWIVNVNDVCGLKWLPLASDRPISPAYACSKSALTALTESLRLELAQNESNIKVINICPGLVETEVTQQWLKENSRLALKPKDVADAILYTLQTPENVLIKDLIITPIREII